MAEGTTCQVVLSGGDEPHRYDVLLAEAGGGRLAEGHFEWRSDSTAHALDLHALQQAALSGSPPEDELHVRYGRELFSLVFSGAVGEAWHTRLGQGRVRLVLRIDPVTARPLLNLPWEYFHDGDGFLALRASTPFSRLPWRLDPAAGDPLAGPVRVLVVIAAPNGLDQNMVLNSALEEDLILAATRAARESAGIEVVFTVGGSLEELESALREHDPHVLHFTGHGIFDPEKDSGRLLMEARDGSPRQVANDEFARLLESGARSLRLVFLSACQSAVAPRQEGYADLAPRLLEAGIPAVVAMQFSVLNSSAMSFGAAFYRGVAAGRPLDEAMVEARRRLAQGGTNSVDFATPVLFLSDPLCLQVADGLPAAPGNPPAVDLTGLAAAQNFVGRTAELRLLLANLDPEQGGWRAAVVHGMAGIGKTVLAARLAERMRDRLAGVKSVRMGPATSAERVLQQIGVFLLVNGSRFGVSSTADLVAPIRDADLPLEARAAAVVEVLRRVPLLLVFDGCEEGLTAPEVDPDSSRLIALLVEGMSGPSRFLFTSRIDFSPLGPGRLTGALGHMGLGELPFRDAVYMMETLEPLARLPVAVLGERESGALSMRELHRRLGGHPLAINLFAEHARRSSVEAALEDLGALRRELLEVTQLERAVAQLPDRAVDLARRTAIYEEPVPRQALAYLMGDERNAAPAVEDEVRMLLAWGLLAQAPGSDLCAMPTILRAWLSGQIDPEERKRLLRRAAQYWLAAGRESPSLEPERNAHRYLLEAGDFEAADDVVVEWAEYLQRWGLYELLGRWLGHSVRTTTGERRSRALMTLGGLRQRQSDYSGARRYTEQALELAQAAGNPRRMAGIMLQLGQLHEAHAEFEQAADIYRSALATFEDLGVRTGVFACLHGLATVRLRLGDYDQARNLEERALAIAREAEDARDTAASLHSLGLLHEQQAEYEPARDLYEQSLALKREVGDRAGMANTLHQLARVHAIHGEYERARDLEQRSLALRRELGDRAGMAASLLSLGTLHMNQGEFGRARDLCQQSLAIAQEIGGRREAGACLYELGRVHEVQLEHGPARYYYRQALALMTALGDRFGMARALGQLGNVHLQEGDLDQAWELYHQAMAMNRELGDRAMLAHNISQVGLVHEDRGEFGRAHDLYLQALAIQRELRAPAEIGTTLGMIAAVLERQGDLASAVVAFAQCRAQMEQIGNPLVAMARAGLDRLRLAMGEEPFRAALERAALETSPGVAPVRRAREAAPPGQLAWALVQKAATLAALGRREEAIAGYQDVVRGFGDASDPAVREQVAHALFNEAVALSELGRPREELAAYEEIELRAGDAAEPTLRELVAKALFNHGVTLGELGRPEEELASYGRLERRLGDAVEPAVRDHVVRAMFNKGVVLGQLGRWEAALAAYDEVERRFAGAAEPIVRDYLAAAMLNRAIALGDLGRREECVAACEEIERRFRDAHEPVVLDRLASAMVHRGVELNELGRPEEAATVFEDVERRFGGSAEPEQREQVARAMRGLGALRYEQGRWEDGLAAYELVEERFGRDTEPALREQVGWALFDRWRALSALGRSEEELTTYEEVQLRFGEDTGPVRELVAWAMRNRAVTLGEVGRGEESVVAFEELDRRFADAPETAIRVHVAWALLLKGIELDRLERPSEVLAAYDELERRFGAAAEPAFHEPIVRARIIKGSTLTQLGRLEEALAAFAAVDQLTRAAAPALQDLVSRALLARASILGELGRPDEALAVYEEFERRFGEG